MKQVICRTEAQTKQAGFDLAKQLSGGEVLALYGELGAGKTKFVQGLAAGLGIKNRITSPTFNIFRVYQLRSKRRMAQEFYHIDAYRLSSGKELTALGAREFLGQASSIVAIEWAEKVADILPRRVIAVRFTLLPDGVRKLKIT